MKQWQYHVEYIGLVSCKDRDILDTLGREGWELAAIDSPYYVFKREVTRETKELP